MDLHSSALTLGLPLAVCNGVFEVRKCTVVVDTHAMVERFFSQLFPGVLEDCFRKWCCREGNAVHSLRRRLFETVLVAEKDSDITRLGSPAVGVVD